MKTLSSAPTKNRPDLVYNAKNIAEKLRYFRLPPNLAHRKLIREAELRYDFRLSATIYSHECLGSEGENPAIFYCAGNRVRVVERINRT